MGIVIVPCFKRPELLCATLLALEEAHARARHREHQFMFSIDRGFDHTVLEVLRASPLSREADITIREHEYPGPRYNILEAWRDGFAVTSRETPWVALIEDDVIVAHDFFDFVDDALALDPYAFGVSACRNQNAPELSSMLDRFHGEPCATVTPSANSIYQHTSYQSLAVALRPSSIENFLEHATPAYYADPINYCARWFPGDTLSRGHASQDGLIHRVIRQRGEHLLYPVEPRAFHAGWYGTNRSDGRSLDRGTWMDEGAYIVTSMTSGQMNALADPRFRDIERCELVRKPVPLKLV